MDIQILTLSVLRLGSSIDRRLKTSLVAINNLSYEL